MGLINRFFSFLGKDKQKPDMNLDLNHDNDIIINDNAYKKHVIITLLMNPKRCNFIAKDAREAGKTPFWFDNGLKLSNKHDATIGGIFVWLLSKTSNREGFVRIMEILDQNTTENWLESMLYDSNTLVENIKTYFPMFSLGNDPNEVKTSLQWAWIDIKAILKFMVNAEKFVYDNNAFDPQKNLESKDLASCSTIQDLYLLFIDDIKKGNLSLH